MAANRRIGYLQLLWFVQRFNTKGTGLSKIHEFNTDHAFLPRHQGSFNEESDTPENARSTSINHRNVNKSRTNKKNKCESINQPSNPE